MTGTAPATVRCRNPNGTVRAVVVHKVFMAFIIRTAMALQ
jgi:hypothetical protein